MKRPPLEVADIIRAVGRSFIDQHRSSLTGLHLKVLSAIERCRTAALGGHRDRCTRCGYTAAISSHIFNLMYDLPTFQRPSASLLIGVQA